MRDRGLSEEDIEKLQHLLEVRKNKSPGYMAPQIKAEKPSESRCPECGSRITDTPTWGEVGHKDRCPRRETHYRGRVGSMAPTPPNARYDRELVTDGGEP